MIKLIAQNLYAGMRLLLPSRVSQDDFHPSLTSASIGLVLSLLSIAGLDYLRQEGEIVFNDYGAAMVGCLLFIVLLVSIGIARMNAAMERLPLLLTVLSSAMPWYVTIVYVSRIIESLPLAVSVLMLVWGLLILARAIQLAFEWKANRGVVFAVSIALLVIFVFQYRFLQASLFYSYDPAEYESYSEIDIEDVFYQQPALVADKVGKLLKERPDRVDTYFVGFAGNGDQTIFSKEVLFAEQVVEKQFDAGGRSISFRNHIDSLQTEPLANRHNLRAALRNVGEIMNTDEDLLFLFLTSHGSKDAKLDTSLYPFDLQDLAATDVRKFLDESGILWRIVVVSACYSGSFIDALRDDRTLVLSASDSDRNSFGCSDDRELTYFGEEFFASQLSSTSNLIEAFESASESIRSKELAKGLTPSEPQIFIGPLIRDKLAEQVRQLPTR